MGAESLLWAGAGAPTTCEGWAVLAVKARCRIKLGLKQLDVFSSTASAPSSKALRDAALRLAWLDFCK